MVLAPEHELALEISKDNNDVKNFIKKHQSQGNTEEAIATAEKEGYAIS